MAFLTGLYLIDASASALNNGRGEGTTAPVKAISTAAGTYPYVSAQAFRYWLRDTLADHPEWGKRASPVTRSGSGQKQQAFTEGDPIKYWDDDLLGYMRAEKSDTLTRVAPFRTSTVVSLAPTRPVEDFGVMTRGEGDPVLHAHEFYRTVLRGVFSLDLRAAGAFTTIDRTGYKNLSPALEREAKSAGARQIESDALRLPLAERVKRIKALLWGLAHLEGGAKQTLHLTDVGFAFLLLAVTKGGNQPFSYVVQPGPVGKPMVHAEAFTQAVTVFGEDVLSPVFVARAAGFFDDAGPAFEDLKLVAEEHGVALETGMHPREALLAMGDLLDDNPSWLD